MAVPYLIKGLVSSTFMYKKFNDTYLQSLQAAPILRFFFDSNRIRIMKKSGKLGCHFIIFILFIVKMFFNLYVFIFQKVSSCP